MSNSLGPDQNRRSVGSDPGPNGLQRLSTDSKRREVTRRPFTIHNFCCDIFDAPFYRSAHWISGYMYIVYHCPGYAKTINNSELPQKRLIDNEIAIILEISGKMLFLSFYFSVF